MALKCADTYPFTICQIYLAVIKKHIKITMGRMILAPPLMTKFAPSDAPMICPTIMTMPTVHTICPPITKNINEARLVAKLSSLALAVACTRLIPRSATAPSEKNVPVPGPK